jgi:hypothetical protein
VTTPAGPYRWPGKGPRLTQLSAVDVGPLGNRADGTGLSIAGAGGGTTTPVGTKVQAAQAILVRFTSDLSIFEDWTWVGMPAVVETHNDALVVQYRQETNNANPLDDAAATAWLQAFIASGGTSGQGTGPGAATSVSSLLKIGKASGWGKFDIGIGFAPGDDKGTDANGSGKTSSAIHRNYGLSIIERPLSIPGYFELTPDRTRARLSAHLDGGRTSEKTQYPRTEFRAYDIDGTTKMACNPNEGTRYIIHKFVVTRMPPAKPELVVAQWHDAEDDTAMVRYRNKTTVEAKLGDTVLGNLTTSAQFNVVYTTMIKIVGDGSKCKLEFYWQDMNTPKFTTSSATRSTGWYEKVGCYAQSNSSIDQTEDGPFIVESLGIGHWHSKTPKSSSPWPEPAGLKP